MKRNNTNNNIYREVEHNGTRIKILDKNYIRITDNHNHYIVPRATHCVGKISSFDITFDNESLGYYHNDNEGILWINDNKMKHPIIACKAAEEIPASKCEGVIMTIFHEGDDKIVMQKSLVNEYDNYYFVKGDDYETLPDAGKYIAIVSGMQHQKSCYNYNKYHMVIPFSITNGTIDELRISKAECSLQSTNITGSTTPLQVRVQLDSTSRLDSVLNAQCFDSEMNLIAHNNIALAAHQCGNIYNFAIQPNLFWIENEHYTIVINDSEQVLSTLTFNMTHNSRCEVRNADEIERVYRNTMHLNTLDYRLLQSVSGMSEMRRKIFMQYEEVRYITQLNTDIDELNLSKIHHAIVYKSGAYEKSPILNRAYAVANILWGKHAELLNCQALCDSDDLRQLYSSEDVCIWTHLDALYNKRKEALHHIQAYIKEEKHIILYDSHKNVEKFFTIYPELRDLFDTQYTFEGTNATVQEVAYRFYREIRSNKKLLIGEEATRYIYNTLADKIANNECIDNYDHNTIGEFIRNSVVYKVERRILAMPLHKIAMMGQEVKRLHPEDIDFSFFATSQEKKPATQDVLCELNAMTGLHNIKQEITALSTLLRFNQQRARLGLKASSTGRHHMIFTGNPGTGKTTVAKMIGMIFYNLGLLSSGKVVVTERSKILGRYIGDTENNMREIIDSARGGVLFIDEAYTLCRSNDDNKDFGRHAIETLLTILAEEDSDILVILAGYKEEMDNMLSINTGLRGRFPHQWHFDDYSCDELMQIAYSTLEQEQYTLSAEADMRLRKVVTQELIANDKEFSNARWIKQYITHSILPTMAQRVSQHPLCSDRDMYSTIEGCDIPFTQTESTPGIKKRNRIGYCTLQHYEAA